jgi:hypothetical protein
MRPYDQELVTCQRYWQRLGGDSGQDIYILGYQLGGFGITATLTYPVEMRSNPTAGVYGTWSILNLSNLSVTGAGKKSVSVQATVAATGAAYAFTNGATNFISLDARL